MSWPACPVCQSPRVPVLESRPTRLDGKVVRVRTYRCEVCDWSALSCEAITQEYPDTLHMKNKLPKTHR